MAAFQGGMPLVATCEISGLLRRCRQPGVAVCQYCGRSFCNVHGGREEDGQEVCNRKPCQRKKADLAHHVAYRASVAERNERKLCGDHDCQQTPTGQCSKCRGFYCLSHLDERNIATRRGGEVVRTRGSLCRHCRSRRSIWDRD